MEVFVLIIIVMSFMLLWINFLAMLSIKYDATLDRFQKIGQSLIVWFIPYVGAGLVLKFVYEHSPDAIPKTWIPWPFKGMIYGREPAPNQNRDEVVNDGEYNSGNSSSSDSAGDGGGDGGD